MRVFFLPFLQNRKMWMLTLLLFFLSGFLDAYSVKDNQVNINRYHKWTLSFAFEWRNCEIVDLSAKNESFNSICK